MNSEAQNSVEEQDGADASESGEVDPEPTSADARTSDSDKPAPVCQPAARDPLIEMDEESPTQVVKTFIVLSWLASILCLLPRQYASAAILFGATLVFIGIHRMMVRRSRAKENHDVSSRRGGASSNA